MNGNSYPKISVITPSLNQGRFLEQCLQSVLAQNYPNLELIVIDGGSKDQSLDIIRRYAPQITHWVSEPDAGQSDAINKGFRIASGELVAWLNADDFYLQDSLHQVAAAFQQHPNASFIFGDGIRVDEQGQKKSIFWEGQQPFFDRKALIFGLNYILQPASFINLRCLQEIGYLNPTLQYGMDTDLWIRLSGVAEPIAIPAILAASREYGETKTSSGSFARIEELRKITEEHSGLPLTPGVLCYYLDTLHHFVEAHPKYFPESYRLDLLTFWSKSAALMRQFNAQPNGLPIRASVDTTRENQGQSSQTSQSRGLRTWLGRFKQKIKAILR